MGKCNSLPSGCVAGDSLHCLLVRVLSHRGVSLLVAALLIGSCQASSEVNAACMQCINCDTINNSSRFCCPVSQVEIEIDTCDKGGTFLGTITLAGPKPVNLGTTLARMGLAKTQQFFAAER